MGELVVLAVAAVVMAVGAWLEPRLPASFVGWVVRQVVR